MFAVLVAVRDALLQSVLAAGVLRTVYDVAVMRAVFRSSSSVSTRLQAGLRARLRSSSSPRLPTDPADYAAGSASAERQFLRLYNRDVSIRGVVNRMRFNNRQGAIAAKLKARSLPVLTLVALTCCLSVGCVGPDSAPQSVYAPGVGAYCDYRGQAACQTCPASTVSTVTTGLYKNTVTVTCCNPTVLWEALVDPIRKYFPIVKEEQCRQMGNVVNPGKLITGRTIGSSIFEPGKGDSVGMRQRWESTIHTIARRAEVHVWPSSAGPNSYIIEVVVTKEIENNPRPENSRIGQGNYFLSDSRRSFTDPIGAPEDENGLRWINKGRDPLLEQRLLAEIEQSIRRKCR